MKNFTVMKLPALVLGLLLFSLSGWGQGFESFNNSTATASYADGSFIGDNSFTWTFGHSRDEGAYPITGNGLMLRRASDSYLEAVIPGGIGTFSFEYRKAFTGTGVRQLELIINGVQVATTPEFGPTEPDPTIYSFTVNNINSEGNVTVKIKNVGTTTLNRQTVIDNIEWTGFTAGGNTPPFIFNITQNPSADITSITTVSVAADVTDSDGTVDLVELRWGTATGVYPNTIPMSWVSGDTYVTNTDIPAQLNGTTVYYVVYAEDNDEDGTTSPEQSYTVSDPAFTALPYNETFDSDLGDCYNYTVAGIKPWYHFTQSATANGFAGQSVEEHWLVLPGINLDNYSDEVMSFTTYARYGSNDANNFLKLFYSADYTGLGDVSLATWTELSFTQPGGINNTTEVSAFSGDIDISVISGTSVFFAFQYYSTDSPTRWRVDDISIIEKQYPVTFYLDMTNEVGTFTTVDVAGSFNGWGSPGDQLTLLADNIYEFTTAAIFSKDDIIEFKFRKDGDWGTSEPNPNRTYTVVIGDNIYHAVYGVMVPAGIGYANLQWPPAGSIDLGWNYDVYAQVYADGLTGTQNTNPTPNLGAWIGFSTTDTDPATWTNWVTASFNVDAGNNDEFVANIGLAITESGTYYYASRFKLGLADYVYGGYDEFGGGFWDGINNVSGVLTVNINEPDNHVTNFIATSNSYSAITLTWTDSDAAGYLVKGSAVSYAAIDDPVDGTPEADGGLVKNVVAGVESHQFAGLMAETDYFFKIFPYNGTAGAINYKTDGMVPEATAKTGELPGYLVGDYGFTAPSGNWGTTTNWRQWDGTGWNTTVVSQPTASDNVYILSGNTAIVETGGKNAAHLIVEAGAKLFSNNASMGSPRYISVTGNIICDGMIGNGSGVDDVISFNINGTAQTISGSGSFTGNRIRKNATGNSSLSIGMDIELRFNGFALYNQASIENAFHVTIQPGVHLNCSGNGVTPVGGYQLKSNDNLIIYGQVTLTGNLDNQAGSSAVVVKSSASGNGSLIQPNEAPATVEAYITPTRWHYVSSPINNPNTSIFSGLYMMWWDEPNGDWVWVLSADSTLATDMQGYSIWAVSETTLNFAGTLNAGARSYNLTRNDPKPGLVDPGFNFVGNPYPSAIDWDGAAGWTKTDVDNAIYVWVDGQYGAYINGNSVNGLTNIIPPHQGFFVHTSSTFGGFLGVNNEARLHSAQPNLKSGSKSAVSLRLDVKGNSYSDETVIYQDASATMAFDGHLDAYKLKGIADAPQLYSMAAGGTDLSINAVPVIDADVTIPLGFETGIEGVFEIKISDISGFDGIPVFLQDMKDNKVINFKSFGTYKFAASPGDNEHRFTLHFSNNNLPSDDIAFEGLFVYGKEKSVVVVSETELNGVVKVFDLAGREVVSQRLNESTYTTIPVSGNKGYYIVNLITEAGVYNQKVFLK